MKRALCLVATLAVFLMPRIAEAQFNYDAAGNAKFSLCNASGICVHMDGSGNVEMVFASAQAVTQSGTWNFNQTLGAAGYGFLVDSGGSNVAGVNSSHQVLTLDANSAASKADLDTLAGAVSSSKFQINIASGSIANTVFASTESGTWSVNQSTSNPGYSYILDSAGTNVGGVDSSHNVLVKINAGSIANSSFASTQSGTWGVNQTTGNPGYGYILDSAGTNVGGVDSSHNVLTKDSNGASIATNTSNTASNTSTIAGAVSSSKVQTQLVDSAGTNVAGVDSSHNLKTIDSNSASILTALQNLAATSYKVCSGSGNIVVKASSGRLYGVEITTTYATTALTLWDNASTNSGNTIFSGATTSGPSTSLDQIPAGGIPFSNGLTCNQGATGVAVIVYS